MAVPVVHEGRNQMEIMRRLIFSMAVITPLLSSAQAPAPPLAPPVARMTPRVDTTLGDVRTDNYYWIRDDARKNPDVIAYLDAENRYTEAVMKPHESLIQKLYEEMKGRIKETDLSVPERVGNYFYYTKTEAGKQYPILARKKGKSHRSRRSDAGSECRSGEVKVLPRGHHQRQPQRPTPCVHSGHDGKRAIHADGQGPHHRPASSRPRADGELLPRVGGRQPDAILWYGRFGEPVVSHPASCAGQQRYRRRHC